MPALSFWIAIANRFAAHSTIRLPSSELTVFRRRKAFLLCKNPCAESGFTSLSYPRLESAQKYVTLPDWENLCTGQPRGARGTAVPLFREASRGTSSKGFLWATSSRRLDTALLFADKKRGVETYQAGRVLPVNPWSLDHGSSSQKNPLEVLFQNQKI